MKVNACLMLGVQQVHNSSVVAPEPTVSGNPEFVNSLQRRRLRERFNDAGWRSAILEPIFAPPVGAQEQIRGRHQQEGDTHGQRRRQTDLLLPEGQGLDLIGIVVEASSGPPNASRYGMSKS